MTETIAQQTQRLVEFYREFKVEDIDRLGVFYARDAHFRDPFNDVHGLEGIAAIYRHMFAHLNDPQFDILQTFTSADMASILWRFRFSTPRLNKGRSIVFDGVSVLTFDDSGLVKSHIDYWDPAASLYRHIPILGRILAGINRRLSASD